MRPDPTIDEIRQVRRMISAEYGNDPRRMLEYFAALQQRLQNRLVSYGAPPSLGATGARTSPADPPA